MIEARTVSAALAPIQRLHDDNPRAFAQFVAWIGDTEYGEVTLRFQGGTFCMVEQTRRAK